MQCSKPPPRAWGPNDHFQVEATSTCRATPGQGVWAVGHTFLTPLTPPCWALRNPPPPHMGGGGRKKRVFEQWRMKNTARVNFSLQMVSVFVAKGGLQCGSGVQNGCRLLTQGTHQKERWLGFDGHRKMMHTRAAAKRNSGATKGKNSPLTPCLVCPLEG